MQYIAHISEIFGDRRPALTDGHQKLLQHAFEAAFERYIAEAAAASLP